MTAQLDRPESATPTSPVGPAPGGGFLTGSVPRSIFCREKISEDAELFVETAEKFWKEQVLDQVEALENKEMVTVDGVEMPLAIKIVKDAAELGLLALDIPETYDGIELDKVTSFRISESFAGCASQATTFGAHSGIGTLPIVYFGNDDQKKRYLPKLAAAEIIGCYALTEPGSGSDALSGKTTARLSDDGTHYLLTGEKIYISNGGWADLAIVFARLDGLYSAFIVDLRQPGASAGAEEKKMGLHGSSTTPLIFEDAKVPLEDLLGKPGDAAKIALNILYLGRMKLGLGALGTAKYAIDRTIQFGRERKQFGQAVGTFEMQKAKLADMLTRTFALDSTCYRIAGDMDTLLAELDDDQHGGEAQIEVLRRFGVESSLVKIFGSETLMRVANHAVRMHGGYGFCREYQVERVLRDNVVDTIFEGTNDVNRMVLFGEVVKSLYGGRIPFRTWMEAIHADCRAGRFEAAVAPSPFADLERRVLALKRATGFALERGLIGVGKDVRVQQQVMSRMADALVELLACESALARAIVLYPDGVLRSSRPQAIDAICRLSIYDALREVDAVTHEVLAHTETGAALAQNVETLEALLAPARVADDVYGLRNRLAEYAIEHDRYPF